LHLQEGNELRLAYKLKYCHVFPTQYEKMRVCLAAQFFSRSTAAAIEVCVKNEIFPREALTTAWFLNFVNDWFDAMNARHKDTALYKGKRTAQVEVMEEMLEILPELTFSGRRMWKPVQTGIQLSTTVALQLSQEIMAKYRLQYFLTGRLTQDPVENLFSQARGQGVMHPTCTTFRQALRLVTIAQYLHVSKGAAYEEDGCTYLVDYLKDRASVDSVVMDTVAECDADNILSAILNASADVENCDNLDDESAAAASCDVFSKSVAGAFSDNHDASCVMSEQYNEETVTQISPIMPDQSVSHQALGCLEGNALYDVIGWSVSRFFTTVDCEDCRAAFVADGASDCYLSQFTTTRSYGGLTRPTSELFCAAKIAELQNLFPVRTSRLYTVWKKLWTSSLVRLSMFLKRSTLTFRAVIMALTKSCGSSSDFVLMNTQVARHENMSLRNSMAAKPPAETL